MDKVVTRETATSFASWSVERLASFVQERTHSAQGAMTARVNQANSNVDRVWAETPYGPERAAVLEAAVADRDAAVRERADAFHAAQSARAHGEQTFGAAAWARAVSEATATPTPSGGTSAIEDPVTPSGRPEVKATKSVARRKGDHKPSRGPAKRDVDAVDWPSQSRDSLHRLSGSAARVAITLLSFAKDDGSVSIGLQQIVDVSGVSRAQVSRAIAQLQEADMLRVRSKGSNVGRRAGQTNVYQLTRPKRR